MIDRAIWDEPDMWAALARRDIPAVYRRLKAAGVTQRDIAALTGQHQSEVSEIMRGRPVVFYHLLERIADGLGAPRGHMGLAHDATSAPQLLSHPPEGLTDDPEELTDDVKRRRFVATAASFVVGAPVLGPVLQLDVAVADTPLPAKIGRGDVKALHAMTEHFRALGRAGHGVPDVLSTIASRADRLLTVPKVDGEIVRKALLSQLADLHTLAGWWHYDMLQVDSARWHYHRAMELAAEAGDVLAMVSAVRHAAVIYREAGEPNDALKLLQLAQARLLDVPASIRNGMGAWLHVQSAEALAMLDRPDRARDELAKVAGLPLLDEPFERADMDYVRARIQLRLGRVDDAEQHAASSLATFGPAHLRDSVRARITLAVTHAMAEEPDTPRLATTAIDAVDKLRSVRTRSMLAPLERALAARKTYAELAQRARVLRVASV